MDLKSFVLERVLPEIYYQKRFPSWNTRSRQNQNCLWHEDSRPSMSVGLNNGGARCHSCDKRLGNIVHFESEASDITELEAARKIYREHIRPVVADTTVAKLHDALLRNEKVRKTILGDTGIAAKAIDLFKLGWDATTKRIAIPIFDRWNQCVNLRLYKCAAFRNQKEEHLKVLNLKGFGGCDLFSWPHFEGFTLDKPVFVMPSEKEMMLGMQFGLQCVCATAGEMAWEEEWNEFFTGYDIAIVAQRDETGAKAAEKKLAILQKVEMSCHIIEPPTKLKDFGDFVVKEEGQGIHLLAEFMAAKNLSGKEIAPAQTSDRIPNKSVSDTAPQIPPLFSEDSMELAVIGSNPDSLNQVVRTQGIVAAKSSCTYTIPWKFKVKYKGSNERFYSIPAGRTLLGFIKASDSAIRDCIRDMLGQDKAEIVPAEYITCSEVEVIPVASIEKDVPYVTQRCFSIDVKIEANVPYDMSVIPTTDSRTQETIGLIVGVEPIARSVESASFSAEELASLQVFQPVEGDTIWSKLNTIAEEVSRVHSKIYNRPDWHIVALLTWLSPIGFAFPFEKRVERGWMNSLALGDSQTGKSKVVETLQALFKCGTIINAENCTYVGLVGGAVKMGSQQFMLRWGRIPLCDKQLVVIEELSGLDIKEISNMSDVRSSGVARLDKGGLSAQTNARTRLLALSNVRPINRNLASYLSGVTAVQELIGHGEDIARFDLITTLVDRDVPVDVINKPFSNKGCKDAIPEELWQRLCQFVWSLKANQIRITTDAYYKCLDETKRLADIYHPAIPIFKGGSGRYKIARIGAAIACLQFSWNGKSILVHEEHIEAASQLLETLYNKQSFGYYDWSQQMFDRDAIKDRGLLDRQLCSAIPNASKRGKAVEALVHAAKFTRDELCAFASIQITAADDLIGYLARERALRKGVANLWEITPAGRDWLLTHLNDEPLKMQ